MSPNPTGATYSPGSWVAVSADGCWLLVDLPPENEIVQRCWSLMSEGAAVDDVLDALVSGGIRNTAGFALARVATDEQRVVTRGSATLRISAAGQEDVTLAAAPGSAWSDVALEQLGDELLLVGDKSGNSGVELPMAAGVTMAASIRVQLHSGQRPTIRTAEPAPAGSADGSAPGAAPVAHPPMEDRAPVEQAQVPPEPVATGAAEHEVEPAPSYDFLFGATAMPPPLGTEEPVGATPPTAAASEPPVADMPVTQGPLQGPSEATAGWYTLHGEDVAPLEPPPAAPPPAAEAPPTGGLIDSLPWATPASEPAADVPRWTPPAAGAAQVWLDAQVVDGPPEEAVMTVDRSTLGAVTPLVVGPTVLAGYCPAGHLSPPHAAQCRVCGAPMPAQQPFEIARPPLGRLRLASGDAVMLDRGVLIGRAPDARADGQERPHLLRVTSPDNDVSRNHAEIVLDGWHVYVRDLGSTNGTVVTLLGQPPQRLRPNDLQLLENGSVLTLADEVSLTFEVTS